MWILVRVLVFSVIGWSVCLHSCIVNSTIPRKGGSKKYRLPSYINKSKSTSLKTPKYSKARRGHIRSEFRAEVINYVNSKSNASLPVPLSVEEDDHLLHGVRLRNEILIGEANAEKELANAEIGNAVAAKELVNAEIGKAVAAKELVNAEIGKAVAAKEMAFTRQLWVSALMQGGLGIACICLAAGFIIASFNIGRGRDTVYKEFKIWIMEASGIFKN